MEVRHLADDDCSGAYNYVPANPDTIRHHDVCTKPNIIINIDPLRRSALMEHRHISAIVSMIASD